MGRERGVVSLVPLFKLFPVLQSKHRRPQPLLARLLLLLLLPGGGHLRGGRSPLAVAGCRMQGGSVLVTLSIRPIVKHLLVILLSIAPPRAGLLLLLLGGIGP